MTETAGQLVLYGSAGSTSPALNQTKNNGNVFENIDFQNINPQELGIVINLLQEEIKIIKLQLENLPGYAIGKLFI